MVTGARRRRGSGQVIVLLAVGMAALVAFVGLVLVGGLLYWQQRGLQTVADGAALAGSQHITGACSAAQATSVVDAADAVLAANLGGGGALTMAAGSCGTTPYVGTDTYGGGVTATISYPYSPPTDTEVAVVLSRTQAALPFGGLLGMNQATVQGRAVAEHSLATLPASFGLVAQDGLACQGSGSKIDVQGSIYAGPSAIGSPAQSILTNGNCAIYAHRTQAANSTTDWGDILAYDDGQQWLGASGYCSPPAGGVPGFGVKASVCADGFELSGVASAACAAQYPPSPPGSMYMDASEVGVNLNPCDGEPPPVPIVTAAQFMPPEPNQDPHAVATLTNGASGAGTPCTPGMTLSPLSFSWKGATYTGYGTGPSAAITVDADNWVHFQPGCYGYLNVQQLINSAPHGATPVAGAVLDPGFYYFNGSGFTPSGGGLCLGGTISDNLLGQDVTLEFVNSTSFSDASCDASPSNGCGASKACDFGSAPAPATPLDGFTWFSAPCTPSTTTAQCPLGSSAWCPTSDSSCWNTLIWAPPAGLAGLTQIGGTFYVKGQSNSLQASHLFGNVFWPGPAGSVPVDQSPGGAGCVWYANGGGQMVGELICDTVLVQGGASGSTAVTGYTQGFTSGKPRQMGLVE